MLLSQITKAYYINLIQRNDRLEHIQKELTKIGLFAERQEGVLGKNGEGCVASHRNIISKIQSGEIYLIIEDDAVFYDEFPTYAQVALSSLPSKWDLLFFYYHSCCGTSKTKPLDQYLMRIQATKYTHCYAINGSSRQKILDAIDKRKGDIDFRYLCATFELDQIATRKNLVGQVRGFSDNAGIIRPDR